MMKYSKFVQLKLMKTATFVVVFLLSMQIVITPKISQAAILDKPFGGIIIAYVLPTPTCPVPHTLIYDFKSKTVFGISVVPGSLVYAYANLFKAGVFVLGKAGNIVIPCLVPYQIFPIIQVGTSK